MKYIPTIFLQAVIVALGIGALVFMLWEPHMEGVNANATTLYEIYFDDPFLAYAYVSSIAFFIGLYQVFKLLGYAGQNNMFSQSSVRALRTIKYCAVALVGLVLMPLVYLVVVRPEDDIAGGVAMGLFLIIGSTVVASAAAVFERALKNTLDTR
jgi:MFS superfamily sulfate permease-like transporter